MKSQSFLIKVPTKLRPRCLSSCPSELMGTGNPAQVAVFNQGLKPLQMVLANPLPTRQT